jgi:hypothetical protein
MGEKTLVKLVFWAFAPCRLVGICQHFGETCVVHLQGGKTETDSLLASLCFSFSLYERLHCLSWGWSPDDGGSMFLRNTGICLRVSTAPVPRRTSSSSSLPWKSQFLHRALPFVLFPQMSQQISIKAGVYCRSNSFLPRLPLHLMPLYAQIHLC